MFFKKKRNPTNAEQHNYDAQATKVPTEIVFLSNDTAWAPMPYHLPQEYVKFNNDISNGSNNLIEKLIENVDLSAANANYCDQLIDSELYVTLCQMKIMRSMHHHSLAEIATKKKSEHCRLEYEIEMLERENKELIDEED